MARPTKYNKALHRKIITKLLDGASLRTVCKPPNMPNRSTVQLWAIEGKHPEFSIHYAQACELRGENIAEDIFDDIDRVKQMPLYDKKGKVIKGSEGKGADKIDVAVLRAEIQAKQWYAGKMDPKFRDKKEIDLNILEIPKVEVTFVKAGKKKKPVKKKTKLKEYQ